MIDAGAIIRSARLQAGLSEAELARLARTRRSSIVAYESGKREPTVATFARLVRAAGFDLNVEIREPDGLEARAIRQRVSEHQDAIRAIVRRYGGSSVQLFGSVARGDAHSGSDVDLLVDVPDRTGIFTIGRIARDIEELLGITVDVVPLHALRPDHRERILGEAVEL